MFPRKLYVYQNPEGEDGSGGGGDAAARTNDSTPSIDDYDWAGAFKDVSARLDGEDEGEGNPDDTGTTPAPAGTPPPPSVPPAAEPPAAPAPAAGTDHNTFPKSWGKELEPVWTTLPEAAKAQIHKREADVLRGINYYKQGHDFATAITPALEPYKDLIADGTLEPKALVTNLLRGHYLLANSDEGRRVELFRTLAEQYQIPLDKLIGGQAPGQQPAQLDPQVRAHIERLTAELNAVKSQTSAIANTEAQRQRQRAEQESANATAQVQTFVADPARPFATELLPDMYRLVASGAVATLEEAYEQAQWSNPSTRAKLIQKAAETQRLNALKAKNASSVNVKKQGAAGNDVDPPTSLDETLTARLKELRAAG